MQTFKTYILLNIYEIFFRVFPLKTYSFKSPQRYFTFLFIVAAHVGYILTAVCGKGNVIEVQTL